MIIYDKTKKQKYLDIAYSIEGVYSKPLFEMSEKEFLLKKNQKIDYINLFFSYN